MQDLDKNFKFKKLSYDELIINLDRLSRFKVPEISYKRVFFDIISKYSISPKFRKNELYSLEPKVISKLVKNIWNSSVEALFGSISINESNFLEMIVLNTYKNIDDYTKILVHTKLSISKLLEHLDSYSSSINLKFLARCHKLNNFNDVLLLSKELNLLFPVRKLIIVEGITEEILLPIFAKKLGLSFENNGIFILGAGGKSKSPALYNELKNKLKIPIILLFDNDAYDISNSLKSNLNKNDKVIIIEEGEFEDILSLSLIKRTLNNEYNPITRVTIPEIKLYNRKCEFLEEFYRTRNLGEFKKAKFAKMLSDNLKYSTDISVQISNLIKEIV